MLAASPTTVGSARAMTMRIGIVRVALWVSSTAASDPATMTAGLRATSSLASVDSFATCPSAKRKAKATFAPST